MDREALMEKALQCFKLSGLNEISKEKALLDELVSVKIFDEPIMAVADAADGEFEALREEGIVGRHFMPPAEWLPGAESVVSFFFPFTEKIRKSNRESISYPSKGWLNARFEGQYFLDSFSADMVNTLKDAGYAAASPSIDTRFFSNGDHDKNNIGRLFTSNWSERHIAYVCGMGTFSLSKGLITDKGVAGRLTSIITDLTLTPDRKRAGRYNENCIMCGKCIGNCPANAISLKHGKNHEICSRFLDVVFADNGPRYGCGKCQVDVPCEYKNPGKS